MHAGSPRLRVEAARVGLDPRLRRMELPDPPEVGGGTKTPNTCTWTPETRGKWLAAHARIAARRAKDETPGRPPEDRPGAFRSTATPMDERISEGRSAHRAQELPRPRPPGQRTGRPPDPSWRRFRPARPRAAPQSRDSARDVRRPHREDELPRQRAREDKRADRDRRRELNSSARLNALRGSLRL